MTKFNFLSFLLFAAMVIPVVSIAQPKMGAFPDPNTAAATPKNNYYIDYVSGRVLITAPASIAGPVIHTISDDGSGGTTQWGKAIKNLSSAIVNVDIVKAAPYDACGALTNASAVNGKVVLLQRGNCEFGTKALNAQNAGAVAVIIVNNIPGPPVGMGAGSNGANVTIPVVMVSDVDGAAIEAQTGNGAKMTMTLWKNGYNDDIGFVDRGLSLWHAYSVPLAQISGSTAMPFKMFNGAVIANFGNNKSKDVTMYSTLKWTPTGGTTSVVRVDSMPIPDFTPGDSIISPFIDNSYDLSVTSTGRFDVEYELKSSSVTDQFPGDNKSSYSFYVDNMIYSKGRYDFTNNRPLSGLSYRLGGATSSEFTWGPMIYMDKANYTFESVQVALSNGSATNNSMVGIGKVQLLVWKWEDKNADSIITADECNILGLASKDFVQGDTSGQVHTVAMKGALDPTKPVVTEANTWYWVSAAMPVDAYLAVDGVSNYFVRSWGRKHATASIREPYAPLFPDNFSNFSGNGSATGIPQHYPFESYFFLEDSIRFSQQRNGLVPSIPVKMDLWKVGVTNTEKAAFDVNLYPNPSSSDVVNVAVTFNKPAKEVSYMILNALGGIVSADTKVDNTKNKFSVSTSQLAAGSYYLIVSVDDQQMLRKFTVIK